MMKIVITGACGMIGSALARSLSGQHKLVLIDDGSFGHQDNLRGVQDDLLLMDVCDPNIHDVMVDADVVFHMAAISSLPECQSNPSRAYRVNVEGTANVTEACRRNGSRLIFASTSAVYENNHHFSMARSREQEPVNPSLVYAMTKRASEQLIEGFHEVYGLRYTILRYFNVYGPFQDVSRKNPALVGYIINELLAGRTPVLHGDGEQRRDYVYLDDVVRANINAMLKKAGGIFNICSGTTISVNEIYQTIDGILGTGILPNFRPAWKMWDKYPDLMDMRPGRLLDEVTKHTEGNPLRAAAMLQFVARIGMREGLERTIESMKGASQ